MADALKLSDAMFAYHRAEADFSSAMVDTGFGDYTEVSGDAYDASIEFHGVSPDARMNEAAQRLTFEAGFYKAYVNHTDGWETHYTWDHREPFKPVRGWRPAPYRQRFRDQLLARGLGRSGDGAERPWLDDVRIYDNCARSSRQRGATMNGEDDDGNPIGSTAFQHAERMAALKLTDEERGLSEEDRYTLRLHTTKIGEPLLDRLLFDHDRLKALALSATARADAAERLTRHYKTMCESYSFELTKQLAKCEAHTRRAEAAEATAQVRLRHLETAHEKCARANERADLAKRRLADAEAVVAAAEGLVGSAVVAEGASVAERLEFSEESAADLVRAITTYRAATERKPVSGGGK